MKITVKDFLNVRIGKPSVNAPTYQYLSPGSILEVEEVVYEGDYFEGVNKWFKDKANNYYWSGGIVQEPKEPIDLDKKVTYNWFKQLQIEEIWKVYKEKGDNCTVAVLDTGYNINNTDLSKAILTSKVILNYPSSSPCNLINDLNGHGSRCSSIIGSRNLSQYNIGIAPECKLILGKISCKKELRGNDIILEGIEWALSNGAEIISLSYGFLFNDDKEKETFETKLNALLKNKKVLIFASAGNNMEEVPAFGENFPASFPSCISIGATNGFTFSPITLQSPTTILHAPGVDIESYGLDLLPSKDSGTSYATPIAAGIVALALSYYKKKHNNNWDPIEFKKVVYASSTLLVGNKKIISPVNLFKNIASL